MSKPQKVGNLGVQVAIVGGGPGGISTRLAFLKRGFDVRIFEQQPECKAIGGAVLLSTPVLATVTYFQNKAGTERVKLLFNPEVERRMGIKRRHYRVLRLPVFRRMLDLVPEGLIYANHEFSVYKKLDDGVEIEFTNGHEITADILVGADRIWSGVSQQAFSNPKLFHTGIWISENCGVFPMLHDGKPGFKWWVVKLSWDGKLDIFNRPLMKKCMGMAIEDRYYLARSLERVDLRNVRAVSVGYELYEQHHVGHVSHNIEFALFLGTLFHSLPWPIAKFRDLIFDLTLVLNMFLRRGYLQKAEVQTVNLKELHVD
ncbi:hypothetical protein BDW59DRAFT_170477 [Aspergillus cavernicola]|uniref:FAD-binding domain-containing protein n=1 Tax=Aspergillus cavernicola TaxID=176166 RepID=A0ABR4IQA5_9EURO